MSHYPPGTGPNDKKSPWSEPDVKWVDCPLCEGQGVVEFEGEIDTCNMCHGEKEVQQYTEEDENDN